MAYKNHLAPVFKARIITLSIITICHCGQNKNGTVRVEQSRFEICRKKTCYPQMSIRKSHLYFVIISKISRINSSKINTFL
jgi:hypothetical protein